MRRPQQLLFALALCAAPAVASAQAADPAARPIEAFDNVLLETMKQAKALGPEGRYRKLAPAVERTFDLPTMTAFAVGPTWATLPAQDKAALVKAFTRMSVANYAHNFDAYDGQRFVIDKVSDYGAQKLVQTRIVSPRSSTILTYRLHRVGDAWKVIDVLFNGTVSEMATQRSDFAAAVRSGGPAALVRSLDQKADSLLR